MNTILKSVVKNKKRLADLKQEISEKTAKKGVNTTFVNSKPKQMVGKTFADASDFWSSHDNWSDRSY